MAKVTVRVDAGTLEGLRGIAEDRKESVSDVVRAALALAVSPAAPVADACLALVRECGEALKSGGLTPAQAEAAARCLEACRAFLGECA